MRELQMRREQDEAHFIELKKQLIYEHGAIEREKVLAILMEHYAQNHSFECHVGLLKDIYTLMHEGEVVYAQFWLKTIETSAYNDWALEGFYKAVGKQAFPYLVNMIQQLPDEAVSAGIIQFLARKSHQPFDRNLPVAAAEWMRSQMPLQEVARWAQQGFPDGSGYPEPVRHASLSAPSDRFEQRMATLDRKLSQDRNLDSPNMYNWLTPASSEDIRQIIEKWQLPATYLRFLTDYSPWRWCDIDGLRLCGAHDLIGYQAGYAYNTITQASADDWPSNYLVIADRHADPYCLALNESDGLDAPVYTSRHGMGYWKFRKHADSFAALIEKLLK